METKNQKIVGIEAQLNASLLSEKTNKRFFTLSEFRHEVGIPLVLAKKLVIWGVIEAEKAVDGTLRIAGSQVAVAIDLFEKPWIKAYYFIRALGPGLITGASDDDPSGIGTYSSVGAKFGFAILWMAAWLLPMMMAIQEVCARIGIVTNRGLAGVLQKHYKKKIVAVAVVLLIVANIANIGADLGAMAASLQMLIPINFYVAAIFFAALTIVFEIFVGYHLYVKFLKWLAISVFAYIVTGFIIHPDWKMVFGSVIIPQITFSKEYLFAIIAIFGTSITPYLFFWQTSEEVEENRMHKKLHKLLGSKEDSLKIRIGRMRTDVGTGMILANIVFFFIVVTTAQVLFSQGITNINSAEQAAMALRPLAGDYAFLLFAFGIIGTGMLAVPVLAGSGAYALSEIMNWREGLEEKFSRAKGFYLVITVSIIVGLSLNFFHINPILALYYSAFLNGIIALPLLIIIMIVGDDKKIMGRETHPMWVRIFGWLSILFMIGAVIATGILYV
ncbi:MAG: natural resistance-associated macrophage protein [Candidatus Moranbacteria bacterium GW2011_GWA2_39_41]|nr:MAG: natural resistance-associated macrophage protein [Candidatus Moranbacteria bacterium GW2011_GWA2_39_41]